MAEGAFFIGKVVCCHYKFHLKPWGTFFFEWKIEYANSVRGHYTKHDYFKQKQILQRVKCISQLFFYGQLLTNVKI